LPRTNQRWMSEQTLLLELVHTIKIKVIVNQNKNNYPLWSIISFRDLVQSC
jgi:hypothetical protein